MGKKKKPFRRLSEAMRAGARLTKHASGTYFRRVNWQGVLKRPEACPLGTAAYAVALALNHTKDVAANDARNAENFLHSVTYCALMRRVERCPVKDCGEESDAVEHIIIHLTDDHNWPRPKTIKWLESVEAKHYRDKKKKE